MAQIYQYPRVRFNKEAVAAGTTFTGFSRMDGPGIRMMQHSRLWLDDVTFRDIAIIEPFSEKGWQRRRLPSYVGGGLRLPVGTAIVGYSNVLIHTLVRSFSTPVMGNRDCC